MQTTPQKQKGLAPAKSATPTTTGAHDSAVRALQYNGQPVHFTGDGWFNATAAASRFGKEPHDWSRLPETKRYLKALENRYGKIPFLKVVRGGRGRRDATWMHPKLGVSFARWLDVDFAVWCDEQIDHILRGGLSLWGKAAADRSDTPDREALLIAVAAVVARHRLPFGPVYEALNLFAGVAHARDMTCEQVVASSQFAARLLVCSVTPEDFARIERHRAQLGSASAQLALTGLAGGGQ